MAHEEDTPDPQGLGIFEHSESCKLLSRKMDRGFGTKQPR